jgi:hypothetical protein
MALAAALISTPIFFQVIEKGLPETNNFVVLEYVAQAGTFTLEVSSMLK